MLHNQERNTAAQRYIESSLNSSYNDPYTMAIATYALHLANSPMKQTALQMLERLATQENGTKYWKDRNVERDYQQDKPYYWHQPPTTDVEMTAYALLTYMHNEDIRGAMPIMRWLTQHRNPSGGFTSTQDTVIALQGLGMFAERAYSNGLNASVQFISGNDSHAFTVTPRNAIVLQQAKLSNPRLPVQLAASGAGLVSAQVTLRYNTRRRRDDPFDCSSQVTPKSTNDINLSMCCRNKKREKTKMAVMEMNAISGYKINRDQLNTLTEIPDLQRVELEKGNGKANIYFNSVRGHSLITRHNLKNVKIGPIPTCFNVTSSKAFDVSKQKPAEISLYAYYAPEKRVKSLKPHPVSLTIFCGRAQL